MDALVRKLSPDHAPKASCCGTCSCCQGFDRTAPGAFAFAMSACLCRTAESAVCRLFLPVSVGSI
eukprot:6173471-Pleurochrysis_carterae.AAC.1